MDFTKDKRSKWKAIHIYNGVECSRMWMRTPFGASITGCNADGIALQFHADRETGRIVVKELKEKNFCTIGDGDELSAMILEQLGGEEGIQRVEMDRLYDLWGGKDKYEQLFGNIRSDDPLGSSGYECIECGAKLVQKKLRCNGCTNDRPQLGR